MNETAFDEKPSFKMLGLTFSARLDRGSYINSMINQTGSKKESFDPFYEISFFWGYGLSLQVYCPKNTVVIFWMVLLIAT